MALSLLKKKTNLRVCPNVPIPFQVMSHDSKCLCRITSAISFSHRHTFISSSSSSSSSSIVDDYKWGESLILVGWDSRNAGRRCNSNDGGHYSFRIHRENDNNKNKKGDNHQKKTIKSKT